ncbi:unnamed protein product [Protopolystoma xenopodis]|uniref:Uncharacterized protein n=1 Tax=Protopolystoma xenopodis TaxID=117903 RepID=A0A448WTC7_9PLAT|nr:unnamed protein product [Protopolystoma xenopodis]
MLGSIRFQVSGQMNQTFYVYPLPFLWCRLCWTPRLHFDPQNALFLAFRSHTYPASLKSPLVGPSSDRRSFEHSPSGRLCLRSPRPSQFILRRHVSRPANQPPPFAGAGCQPQSKASLFSWPGSVGHAFRHDFNRCLPVKLMALQPGQIGCVRAERKAHLVEGCSLQHQRSRLCRGFSDSLEAHFQTKKFGVL